jgi:hypothetical protein
MLYDECSSAKACPTANSIVINIGFCDVLKPDVDDIELQMLLDLPAPSKNILGTSCRMQCRPRSAERIGNLNPVFALELKGKVGQFFGCQWSAAE